MHKSNRHLVRSEEGVGVGPQRVWVFVGERTERRSLEHPVRHAHFNEAGYDAGP